MSVDVEWFLESGVRIDRFQILHHAAQSATLVGSKRNDGLVVEVILVKECEHHSWISTPPDRTTNEDGVVIINVLNLALERWLLTLFALFFCQLGKRIIRHIVVFLSHDLKLIASSNFLYFVGNKLGIANLDVAYAIVFSCMREKTMSTFPSFSILFSSFFDVLPLLEVETINPVNSNTMS